MSEKQQVVKNDIAESIVVGNNLYEFSRELILRHEKSKTYNGL